MNDKIELLKDLIGQSNLDPQVKLNKISMTLQKTDDIMRIKMLSEKILTGDFSNLKESAIDNLIAAFSINEEIKEVSNKVGEMNNDIDDDKDNRTLNLEYELRLMKQKMRDQENKYVNQIEELKGQNSKYQEILALTKNSKLIEVTDININELYLRYIKNGETSYNEAFVIENVIPKSYYKIK